MPDAVKWFDWYAALFQGGVPLNENARAAMQEYMNDAFRGRGVDPGVTQEEIKAALSDIAESMRTGKTRTHRPDVPEIKTAIIYRRMLARQEREGVSQQPQGCAMCSAGRGWTTLWRDAPEDPESLDQLRGYRASIPCLCSAGVGIMRLVREYKALQGADADAFMRLRRIAVRQTAAWLRMREDALKSVASENGIEAVQTAADAIDERTEKTVAAREELPF